MMPLVNALLLSQINNVVPKMSMLFYSVCLVLQCPLGGDITAPKASAELYNSYHIIWQKVLLQGSL